MIVGTTLDLFEDAPAQEAPPPQAAPAPAISDIAYEGEAETGSGSSDIGKSEAQEPSGAIADIANSNAGSAQAPETSDDDRWAMAILFDAVATKERLKALVHGDPQRLAAVCDAIVAIADAKHVAYNEASSGRLVDAAAALFGWHAKRPQLSAHMALLEYERIAIGAIPMRARMTPAVA